MKVIAAEDMQNMRGPEDWFTGEVWMHHAAIPGEGGGYFRVFFAPGSRTNWHTHPEGQYLHVITGEAHIGSENSEVQTVAPGEVVWFAPNERHWHGAGPNTYMVHLAITPAIQTEGGTDWQEPVSDEQYNA